MTDADLWKAINVYKQRTGVTPTHAYASPRTIQELFAVMFGGPRLDAPPYPVMRCCGVIVVPRNDVPPHTFFLETAP